MNMCKKCKSEFKGGDTPIGYTNEKDYGLAWYNCSECHTTYVKKLPYDPQFKKWSLNQRVWSKESDNLNPLLS